MNPSPKVSNRCPGCFGELTGGQTCPSCSPRAPQPSPVLLPPGTLLAGQYRIGKVLGHPGGFGITYLTWDEKLETRVAIKEFFPRELAGRGRDGASLVPHSERDRPLFEYGLQQFLEEARRLARFDHANIVRVRNFFEANGTGYLVMDYYEGESLASYLARHPGERLAERLAVNIILPVLDGLREVHAAGMLHRDIDPHNIYLTTRGRVILLDFGAARTAVGDRSRSLSVILKPGYAPYEQYTSGGRQGPWSDVYACAATLYRMVTGAVPADALGRIMDDTLRPAHELEPTVSPHVGAVLQRALAVRAEDRPQTAEEFQRLLMPQPAGTSEPPRGSPTRPPPSPQRPQQVPVGAGAAGVAKHVGEPRRPKRDPVPAGAPIGSRPSGKSNGKPKPKNLGMAGTLAIGAVIVSSFARANSATLGMAGTLAIGAVLTLVISAAGIMVAREYRSSELSESVSMLSPAVRSHLDQIGYRPARRLLHEDLSSNWAGWRHVTDLDGRFEIRGGRGYLTTGVSSRSAGAEVPVSHRNMAIRLDLRNESLEDEWAVALAFWSNGNFGEHVQAVFVVLGTEGDKRSYQIHSLHPSYPGGDVAHVEDEQSALINPVDNRLELIATRSTVRLFLNGTHVRTVTGIPEMAGEWVHLLFVGGADVGTQYSFANLVMVELERR